jgi:hypothetical protein
MIDIVYQNHQKRIDRALILWKQIVKEYNGGTPAQDIAKTYINPLTGKHYTRAHIYWILSRMKNI